MFQKLSPCPLVSRLFGRKCSFPDQSEGSEDVDDVIKPSNFCSNRCFINFLHHLFGSLLKRNGGFPADEKLEESTCQVLERLFLFKILNFVIFTFFYASVNGPDSFAESSPFIIIFSFFTDNIQTLENVDNVVDSSSLNTELLGDFVKLNDVVAFALKMLDKFFWEFFQTFSLSVVSEDSIVHETVSFIKEGTSEVFGFCLRLIVKDKEREPLGDEGLEMKIKMVIFIDDVEIGEMIGADVRKRLRRGI